MVNKIDVVDNLRLENQLIELTSLYQPNIVAKVCGICTSMEHPTNMCPTLQEPESNHPESVGAIGGYQYKKQPYQIPANHERQHPRPQDANKIGSKHYEPFTISRVRQPTLTNNPKSEGEC
ncbi:hypothetical protein CR513_53062, partial [Mucuna pruriens]